MHISKVEITGYRSIAHAAIDFAKATVLVGANESGKSNVIRAIRLALDADLPPRDRMLTEDDLARWGDETETWCMNAVRVSVTISEIDTNPDGRAYFVGCLDDGGTDSATIVYTFAPRDWDETWEALEESPDLSEYVWHISGGRGNRSALEIIRNAISVVSLDAVRNPFRDSERWSTSPIKGLLGRRADALTNEEKETLARAISDLLGAVEQIQSVDDLRSEIRSEFTDLSKSGFRSSTHLAATRSEPKSFVRSLRLVESYLGEQSLEYMSTGAQNVLAIAVARKELLERVQKRKTALPILILEEPEAHLHPSMQRAVFSRLLADDWPGSVVVSTHSPALVSVTEPRFVVRVGPTHSRGLRIRSLASSEDAEPFLDEVGKFLHGTRSELLLARRVLLVEGLAESILIPEWASNLLDGGIDKTGISIVAIDGTHFRPFVAVCRALGIPYRVVTDGDPDKRVTGARRKELLVAAFPDAEARIFVGQQSLELDIADVEDNAEPIRAAAERLEVTGREDATSTMVALINAVGKGSLATVLATTGAIAPGYVGQALKSLARD